MAVFKYKATDHAGHELRGIIEADSGRHARMLLREQNLYPASVASTSEKTLDSVASWRGTRLGNSALVLLTRRWAILLGSGMSLEETLNALAEQVDEDSSREILAGVRAEIQAGHPLSTGLERFPGVFPEIYVAMVKAGEKTGDLGTVLERLADYLEARYEARRRLVQALAYPLLVSVVAVAIVVGLMIYVVPTVVAVFAHGKQALPLLTRGLIAVSSLTRQYGWILLALAVVFPFVWARAMQFRNTRDRLHAALLELPVVGNLFRSSDSAKFSATLAILLGSNVPLLEALNAAKRTLRNLRIREAVGRAIERIREGAPIARSLGGEKVFPPMMIHLIASGESSGALPAMLRRAAEQQQKELDHFTALGVAIFEPALIVGMGLLVILIVLAILMPIMEINQLVI